VRSDAGDPKSLFEREQSGPRSPNWAEVGWCHHRPYRQLSVTESAACSRPTEGSIMSSVHPNPIFSRAEDRNPSVLQMRQAHEAGAHHRHRQHLVMMSEFSNARSATRPGALPSQSRPPRRRRIDKPQLPWARSRDRAFRGGVHARQRSPSSACRLVLALSIH